MRDGDGYLRALALLSGSLVTLRNLKRSLVRRCGGRRIESADGAFRCEMNNNDEDEYEA